MAPPLIFAPFSLLLDALVNGKRQHMSQAPHSLAGGQFCKLQGLPSNYSGATLNHPCQVNTNLSKTARRPLPLPFLRLLSLPSLICPAHFPGLALRAERYRLISFRADFSRQPGLVEALRTTGSDSLELSDKLPLSSSILWFLRFL